MPLDIEAAAKFADLADGIVKLGALVLVAYALIHLVPAMRQRGFTATIFGNEVKLNGPSEAVETLSENFKKQIDDLRAQLTALQVGGPTPAAKELEGTTATASATTERSCGSTTPRPTTSSRSESCEMKGLSSPRSSRQRQPSRRCSRRNST